MEDFENNFHVGDEIEATLSNRTYIRGTIKYMFVSGNNSASPEHSYFSIYNHETDVLLENIKFSYVVECRMIKKGNRG